MTLIENAITYVIDDIIGHIDVFIFTSSSMEDGYDIDDIYQVWVKG